MKYSFSDRGAPVGNPIANVFVILVGALVISAAVVLGFVAFVVLGSIIAVLASVIGLRLWWFNRKLRQQPTNVASGDSKRTGRLIEGEYRVVESEGDGASDN